MPWVRLRTTPDGFKSPILIFKNVKCNISVPTHKLFHKATMPLKAYTFIAMYPFQVKKLFCNVLITYDILFFVESSESLIQ